MSSLLSQIGKDKEAMEEEYQKTLEVIFAYGYECCVFKHNICGDHPEVPDGMPDSTDLLLHEFFVNLGCPPIQAAAEAIMTEVSPNEATKEPVEIVAAEDHGILFLRSYVIITFCKGALASCHHWCTLQAPLVLQ